MTSLKLALFIFLALATMPSEASDKCGPCWCSDKLTTALKRADCNGLTTVPTDLPADILDLHIEDGSISKLSDDQFTSYRRLQRILIVRNKIDQIGQRSFNNMTNVTYIELPFNKITELPTECFRFTPNLVKVDLSSNKITRLQSHLFNNMKYLKEVNLYSNEINTLEEHCFSEVPQLEVIQLYSNKLISFDIKFIDNSNSLKTLALQNNPFHCDASLCGLIDTVVSRELWNGYAPTCSTPQNLTYNTWSKSLLTELNCSMSLM